MNLTINKKVFIYPILAVLIATCILWNAWCAFYAMSEMNMNDFGKFYYATLSFLHGQDMYGPNPATLLLADQNTNNSGI